MNPNNSGPQNYPTRGSMRVVQPYNREYTVLTLSIGEVVALGKGIHSESTPRTIRIMDKRLTPYLGDLVYGGIVIDQRAAANHSEFSRWMTNGPSVNDTLGSCTTVKDGTQSPCYDARHVGPYNSVSLDLYLALWRSLGARVGKRVGDAIIWEDNVISDIPPAESRWQP